MNFWSCCWCCFCIHKSCTQLLEQQKMWVSWSQIISYPFISTHCYQCQSHYFPGYSIRLIIIIIIYRRMNIYLICNFVIFQINPHQICNLHEKKKQKLMKTMQFDWKRKKTRITFIWWRFMLRLHDFLLIRWMSKLNE